MFQPLFTGVGSSTMDDWERCAERTFAGAVVPGGAAKRHANACQIAVGAFGALSRHSGHARRGARSALLGVGLGFCVFLATGCSAKKAAIRTS